MSKPVITRNSVNPYFSQIGLSIQTKAKTLNCKLETNRLLLEPLTSDHADMLFELLQDEAIYTWISAIAPLNLQTLRDQWKRCESRLSKDGTEARLNWAVRRKSDGRYVGKIDGEVDSNDIATNLGYIFFPPFWKNGYGYEAVHAVVDHLSKSQVKQIRATVTLGNDASARLLEKVGFVQTRIIPENDVIRGIKFDDIEYVRIYGTN